METRDIKEKGCDNGMAVTAEIEKLIEDIHSADRSGDWQKRLAQGHEAAVGSLSATDAALKSNVLNEILRQRVDATILDDVMSAMDAPDSENFAKKLGESSASWAANLKARSEQDVRARPRDLSPEFATINQAQIATMQQALAEGDIVTMLSTMMVMLRQLSQGGALSLGADFSSVAGQGSGAPASAAPAQGGAPNEAEATQGAGSQSLPRPDIDVSANPEGQMLHGYFMDAIIQGNRQAQYREASPETLQGAGLSSAMVAGMAPEDMREMFLAKIERDIKSGAFPYGDFPPEQAAQKAQEITNVLYDYALDHGQSIRRSSKDFNDPSMTSLTFAIDENKLKTAVNVMFSGDAPVMSNTLEHGYGADYFEGVYVYLRDEQNHGAALSADILKAHFDKLLNGYEAPNGQQVPPVLDIPESMHDHFMIEVERASELAREGGFDEQIFGRAMEQSFGLINYESVSAPMRSDVLEHGAPVRGHTGATNENGDVQVNAVDGTPLFALTNPQGGYAIYSVDGSPDNPVFTEIDVINESADIDRLFGAEFDIRAAHIDAGDGNRNPAGYYVEAAGENNRFYISFDALPEAQVTDAFKAARAQDSVSTQPRSQQPAPTVENTSPAEPEANALQGMAAPGR